MANSYRYAYPELKAMYFGIVDYEEAPQIYQQMNLNVAPVLYHFPAKGAKKRADQMDFQRHGFDAESMAKFVLERTEIQVYFRSAYYLAAFFIVIIGDVYHAQHEHLRMLGLDSS